MSMSNPLSNFATYAVDDDDFARELEQALDVTEFVAFSADFSIATGHRESGDPVVFVRSKTPGELHAVVISDPD